ncbi:MAG: hypothetical protein Q8O12_00330 [Candidatus Omnitrophota bacterium]|nr:hypothetical protein [Candidatus Omnitrophota bacterium]
MDKAKTNLVIISVLAALLIITIGYAAGLNSQLSAEKIKTIQLNDQIAGLNAKASDLQKQLTGAINQANDQIAVAGSQQNSLNAANAELTNLKAAYADLESKLKVDTLQPIVK